MNVDSSIAAGETAMSRPATAATPGPPTIRANHQVAATAAIESGDQATTAVGSRRSSQAAGARW
jgi:hypothetical protein